MGTVMGGSPLGVVVETSPRVKVRCKHNGASASFFLAGRRGEQLPIFRAIDDISRSHVNSTADTTDTYCPENLDTLVAHARTLANMGRTDLKS